MRLGAASGSPSSQAASSARHVTGEVAGEDGGAEAAHQGLIVGQIVPGQQHRAEHLAGLEEMVEIGPGVAAAGGAGAGGVERARIGGEAGVAQVDDAARR